MRMKIYQMLVNKHVGIMQRYHNIHDNSGKVGKIISWIYLLWLNFAYKFLFCKWLALPINLSMFEEKNLRIDKAESDRDVKRPEELAKELMQYDVVSFDIFDTLIFRPFSAPTDLFYLIGIELEMMDFTRIRSNVENEVRWRKYHAENSFEVTLEEIWQEMELRTGISKEYGMELEKRYEMEMCYANPYMKQVYQSLKQVGKKIVYTSDMYLPSDFLLDMLKKNGYGEEKLFLSCETNKNKGSGELFDYVKEAMGKNLKYAHIGDNKNSDIGRATEKGFKAFHTMNPNQESVVNRAHDLSPIIGGAYRGIVNNRLYCGLKKYSMNYEFGFVYGGLFAVGYCNFIHEYCQKNGVDKILFLARDGEIIQKVYSILYPEEKTEYALLSRLSASKISAGYYKYDYVRKFAMHKINQGYSLEKILRSMELENLIPKLGGEEKLTAKTLLTNENLKAFSDFLNKHWEEVLETYAPQREAAGKYYASILGDSKKAVAVDIGWAGSGAIVLKKLIREEWKLDCELIGIVAGTNTVFNAEPEMSDGQLLKGDLISYLYSSQENRDLWKKHNPATGYNLYWELITSSANKSFKGFYLKKDGSVELRFLSGEKNPGGIKEIQNGILDFAQDYQKAFGKFPYMYHISGRDAYAPMLVAASGQERYLKKIYKDFELKIEVGA